MADHIYEAGGQVVTGAAAGPILTVVAAALAAGVRVPEIREMGLTLASAVACELIVGQPANTPATPTSPATVNTINHIDPAGHTQVATGTWSTTPTAPTAVTRRAQLPATIGAGIIWVWNPGEFQLYSAVAPGQFLTIWQVSAQAATLDWYVKVAE